MNGYYLKRLLLFNEKTPGFTTDGTPLRLALTVEKLGAEIIVKPSVTNLAPLSEGSYRLIVAGKKPLALPFPLRETRLPHDIFMEEGLSAALYFTAENRTIFIACGSAGKASFSFENLKKEALRTVPQNPSPVSYEDEAIATENYYLKEPYAANPLKTDENENADLAAHNAKAQKDPPLSGEKNADAVSCAGSKSYTEITDIPPAGQDGILASAKGGCRQNYNNNVSNSDTATVAVPFFGEIYDDNKSLTPTNAEAVADKTESSDTLSSSPENNRRKEQSAAAEDGTAKQSVSQAEADPRQPVLFPATQPELYALLRQNPEEFPLTRAVPSALFVRFSECGKPAIAGVITTRPALKKEDLEVLPLDSVRLLCYGTPARDGDRPPEDLCEFCSYLPVPSPGYDGYFLLCFDPKTQKPERLFTA